ncbi:MOSC domain-containing protein [Corticibacter populi]|uniref:MOSC domain-containing protein n=1 Tax=Corticibacter populi TaxID=1550736 RepID=A0A3M6QYK4_9BURK|nr:MOSC domain-containing protein [Corticibacter populi]RMX07973.1 MOSC domain-containing protein [Corticibacter populi]RZS35215.1 hypothetical protein EV687_0275 [Corticibacter populi]
MQVTELWIHPVKSMQGLSLPAAQALAQGFAGDREWLVTDASGRFITARELESLLLWQPLPQQDGLRLVAPDGESLLVRTAEYVHPAEVTVWRDDFQAYGGAPGADAWLSRQLGQPCRLFHTGRRPQRMLKVNAAPLSFADGAPYLLCAETSLASLNSHLAQPVVMRRFRPNIVIDGLDAYAEDGWQRIRIGTIEFSLFKPCARCKIVNLDPETATLSEQKEPLKTLAQTHKLPQGACFGMNLYAHGEGVLHVGDAVEVLA